MTQFLKILQWLYFLIYPKHLTLLIMMYCYINYVIMELDASVYYVYNDAVPSVRPTSQPVIYHYYMRFLILFVELLTWFSSYLSNRKQYIEMNECKSPVITLTHGVPQGSILGPVLFLIYINDISNSTSLNLLSFADDTTIYHSDCDINNLTLILNHELKIYTIGCVQTNCV